MYLSEISSSRCHKQGYEVFMYHPITSFSRIYSLDSITLPFA